MIGEGEETFAELLDGGCFLEENGLTKIAGLAFRKQDGSVCITPPRPVMDLSKVPFVYQDLERFHKDLAHCTSWIKTCGRILKNDLGFLTHLF